MQNPYTAKAKNVLALAEKAAAASGQGYIGTEHILLGLIREKSGVASTILLQDGVEEDKLVTLIKDYIAPENGIAIQEREGYSPKAREVLEEASAQAQRFHAELVGTEHLLLAILKENDNVAVRLLTTMGISQQKLYVDTLNAIGEDPALYKADLTPAKQTQKKKGNSILEQYSRDLTALAREGKLDPVIGRDAEIRRVIIFASLISTVSHTSLTTSTTST